jgi:hypothetical protein
MPGWFSSRALLLVATTQQKARFFEQFQDFNFAPFLAFLSVFALLF